MNDDERGKEGYTTEQTMWMMKGKRADNMGYTTEQTM